MINKNRIQAGWSWRTVIIACCIHYIWHVNLIISYPTGLYDTPVLSQHGFTSKYFQYQHYPSSSWKSLYNKYSLLIVKISLFDVVVFFRNARLMKYRNGKVWCISQLRIRYFYAYVIIKYVYYYNSTERNSI